jgi:hypothetical protein
MKKKLNEASIVNELRGESAYFPSTTAAEAEESAAELPHKRSTQAANPASAEGVLAEPVPEEPAPPATANPTDDIPTTAESDSAPTPQQVIEGIRKAVKRLGKEATFCRFTQEEKNALADIIYTYKRSGIRTSENEVIRIAVNWLLENYHSDGKNSVLAGVLDKLNI